MVKFYARNLQSVLVSRIALKAERTFLLLVFFLKLLEQNGEGNKGNNGIARKQTKAARWEKQVNKRNAAASNESINFRDRMIMTISEIGHVSLSTLIIIVIF